MLLPLLETLPGWPSAPDPNPFWLILLLLIIPLGIGAVVTVIGQAGRWRSGRTSSEELADTVGARTFEVPAEEQRPAIATH